MSWLINTSSRSLKPVTLAVLMACCSGTAVFAQEDSDTLESIRVSTPPHVVELRGLTAHIRSLDSEAMLNRPNRSGSIEEAVSLMSQVQTASNAFRSLQGGEIKPPQISIAGAKPYESRYIINGLNTNNYVAPQRVSSNMITTTGRDSYLDEFTKGSDPTATAQSYNLSPDLLENIEVEDSRISVRHSGFTGGVVSADTRKPDTTRFSGRIHYGLKRSAWDKIFYDENMLRDEDFGRSYSAVRQPEYTRHSGGIMLNIPFSDNWGSIISYDRTQSSIPLYYTSSSNLDETQKRNQKRVAETFFATIGGRTANGIDVSLTGVYYDYLGEYFASRAIKSGFEQRQKTHDLSLNLSKDFSFAKATARLKYGEMKSRRDIESSFYYPWLTLGDKNWGGPNRYSAEGTQAAGSMMLKQRTFQAGFDLDFKPIRLGSTVHRFAVGADLETVLGSMSNDGYTDYIFAQQYFGALAPNQEGVGYNFARTNGAVPDQYFFAKNVSPAVSRKARTQTLSLWLEDTIAFSDFIIRPGVRLDYDDQFRNYNIAPRIAAEWDVMGKDVAILKAGAGRYYGGPNLYHALYKGIGVERYHRYGVNPDGTAPYEHFMTFSRSPDYEARDLDTPYSDELSLGFGLALPRGFSLDYNFVHRESKKGISERLFRDENGQISYAATNDGRSKFRGHTLTLANDYFDNHYFSLSATWSKTKSNYGDYKELSGSELDVFGNRDRTRVIYNGNLINKSDLDAGQFNSPLKVVGYWQAKLADRVDLSTVFTWWDGAPTLVQNGWELLDDGMQVMSYTKKELPSRFLVDMSLGVDMIKHGDTSLRGTLDVYNVLNKKNINAIGFYTSANGPNYFNYYGPGRAFMARLEYRF